VGYRGEDNDPEQALVYGVGGGGGERGVTTFKTATTFKRAFANTWRLMT
jgi:hypothetical protein